MQSQKGDKMKQIKLINSSKGWLARFVDDVEIQRMFGTDTIPTSFTEKASPMDVLQTVKHLNPNYKVSFA